MSVPNETYEGLGFTGRCIGGVTLPRPIEQSPAPEEGVDTAQCAGSEGVRGGGSAPTIAAVIGAFLLLALMLFYVQGTFDRLLYDIGLNWESCGLGLSGGEVLCGDDLRAGTSEVGVSFENGVESWLP